jgi:moderate conductance mechanosensitive channel
MGDVIPGWTEHVIWVCMTLLVALAVVRILRRFVRRWTNLPVAETDDLQRLRRRETAAAVLTTGARYVVFLIAVFALIGILVEDRLPAAAGATLIVLVLGFGAQRFLNDILAGFFILFENQYGVGDFVTVEPTGLSGIVEEFGLRATVLRNLNGDRCFVPNGQIIAVRKSPQRFRSYRVELLTREREEPRRVLQEILALDVVGGARFLRPPEVEEERDLGDDLTLIRIRADVPPTMEWLAEEYLAGALEARLEDALVSKPLVYTLDESAVQRYERTVLVR